MIISLKELLTENIQNTAFVSFIKEQMIDLYGELTESSDIKNNIFLQIIQYNPIFVEIDEYSVIRGTITLILEQKMYRGGKFVAHIEDLVVQKGFRKMGIASNLISYAKDFAKMKGCYKVILNCKDELVPVYEKSGFSQKNVEMSLYF
tara:strand:- start:300 stop:743 length:444 start_codon:yes stop_codon:yes gene_type:complete